MVYNCNPGTQEAEVKSQVLEEPGLHSEIGRVGEGRGGRKRRQKKKENNTKLRKIYT